MTYGSRNTLPVALLGALRGLLVLVALLPAAATAAVQLHGSSSGDQNYPDGDHVDSWSVSAGLPAGTVDGDVLLATVAVRPHGLTVTAPSGWTLIRSTEQVNGGVSTNPGGGTLLTYYKVVGDAGGEPGNYTWNFSTIDDGGGAVVGIMAFGGVDTSNPISAHGGNTTGSGLSHTADAISTGVDQAMVVSAISYLSASDFDTEPQGLTEAIDQNDNGGPFAAIGITLQMANGIQASAGSTGDKTAVADAHSDNGFGHLVALMPADAQPLDCVTFRDEFSSVSYGNQDGTANWATDWDEVGDNNNPANGDIEIDSGRLQLEGDGDGPSIQREADLSAYATATFSFDYDESGRWENNDEIFVYVSDDGGSSWTNIHTFRNDQSPGTFTYDISGFIAADTRIGFLEGASQSSEIFYIDNLQIEACVPAEPASPLADFHMDEEGWDGANGEVTDHTGNGHDGTAVNGADTVEPGKVCRAGSYDGSDDYVELPGFPDLEDSFSITAWFKTNDAGEAGQRIFADDENNNDGYAVSVGDGGNGTVRFYHRDLSPIILDSADVIESGSWYFVAAVLDESAGEKHLYIYDDSGTLLDHAQQSFSGNLTTDGGTASIGGETDSGETNNRFDGLIDEVQVFDGALTGTEIETGYTNQAAGRNWDGSERTCPSTEPPACEDVWANVLNTHEANGQVSHHGQAWDTGDGYLGTDKVATANKGECYPSADPLNYCKEGGHVLALGPPANPANDSGDDLVVGAGETYTINSDEQWRNITVESGGTLVIDGAVTVDARNDFTVGSAGSNGDAVVLVRNVPDGEQAIVYAHNIDFTGDAQTSVLDIDQGTIKFAPSSTMTIEDGSDLNCGAIVTPAPGPGDNWTQGERRECSDTDGGVFVQSWSNVNILDAKARGVFYADGNQSKIGKSGQNVIPGLMQGAFTAGQVNTVDNADAVFGTIPSQDLCTTPAVDHFRILHDGEALTCAPEEVTIQACKNADCSELYTDPVTVTLSPSGWVGGDTISFTGGTSTAELRHTTPGTVTLGATGVSPSADNPTRCFIGGTESCQMTFHEAGFIFDVPTQTSCKPSTDISIQAVKQSDSGVNCAPAFTGDRTVNFWSGYGDPATGTEPVYVNGNNDSNKAVAGSSPGTAVDLTFDASATATFTVDYDDAGQMILNARYEGSGDEAGLVLTGNDIFVSVPVGLAVYATEANHDCASGDSSCSVFKKAGETFDLDVKAACWTGDGDTDFSDNPATPNFELADIAMGHSLVAPSGGVAGNIGITDFDMTAGDDGLKTLNQTVSEVGVFTFTATPPAYFGETIAPATSANIGRFIPDRFTLGHDTPTVGAPNPIYDDVDIDANGDGDDDDAAAGDQEDIFTYLDQPFYYDTDDALATGLSPRLLVTAVNTNGVTTQNYGGDGAGGDDFWMLATDLGSRSYSDQTGSAANLSPTLDGSNPDILAGAADYDGQGTLTLDHGTAGDELVYQRQTKEVPFDADIDLTFPAADLADTDGVCYDVDNDGACDDYVISGIAGMELRFGRLAVYDAYGSELQDLDLPVAAEYYDNIGGGGQGFVVNGDDTITSLAVGEFDDKNFSGNLQDADTDPIAATLAAGDGSVTLRAPGDGNDGEADVEALLGPADADMPWLLYDWDGGGAFDDNPTGHATFGIYQGNQHHIYLREQY